MVFKIIIARIYYLRIAQLQQIGYAYTIGN